MCYTRHKRRHTSVPKHNDADTNTKSTLSGAVLIVLYDSGQSKICYFTEQTLWDQDVCCSQVSVDVILLLYVGHALCYLQERKKNVMHMIHCAHRWAKNKTKQKAGKSESQRHPDNTVTKWSHVNTHMKVTLKIPHEDMLIYLLTFK